MIAIKKTVFLIIFFSLSNFTFGATKNVGAIVGSIRKSLSAGSESSPQYTVGSAAVTGDAIYSGQILNVGSNYITFETTSDESENVVNPFISGVFHKSVKTPILTSSLSGQAVGSIAVTYSGSGLSSAPEIIVDYPSDGDDQATATSTLSSGGIGSISLSNAGTGYDTAPTVTVIAGPHLVKLTESGDTNEGRFFRIIDNNVSGLTLDTSKLGTGESLSDILQRDYSVEIVPAPTLASVMGRTASALPTNFNASSSNGSISGADFIYTYSGTRYISYCFMPAGGSNPAGWYAPSMMRFGLRNDSIMYPDEGFIIAKRTSGALDIDFEGGAQTSAQKMRLPKSGGSACMSNPFGADMLISEIIPPILIGSGANKFNPGSSDTDSNMDVLYLLEGTNWPQYYHKTGVNTGITKVATATAKAGTAAGGGLADADVSLSGGAITNLQSCNSAGNTSIDHNISDHTKITTTGTAPAVGFNVNLIGLFGRKLDGLGDGTHEVDINGTRVSQGSGIFFRSGLNGTYKIIARPSSTSFVVRKKRDIGLDTGKKASGSSGPRWGTGQGGAGYNTNAKAYFMGGGNSTMAVATATVSGGVVTGFDFSNDGDASTKFDNDNNRGAGYSYAPQVVITSGGWRLVGAANPNDVIKDSKILDATEGFVITRKGTNRTLTFFKPRNPFN